MIVVSGASAEPAADKPNRNKPVPLPGQLYMLYKIDMRFNPLIGAAELYERRQYLYLLPDGVAYRNLPADPVQLYRFDPAKLTKKQKPYLARYTADDAGVVTVTWTDYKRRAKRLVLTPKGESALVTGKKGRDVYHRVTPLAVEELVDVLHGTHHWQGSMAMSNPAFAERAYVFNSDTLTFRPDGTYTRQRDGAASSGQANRTGSVTRQATRTSKRAEAGTYQLAGHLLRLIPSRPEAQAGPETPELSIIFRLPDPDEPGLVIDGRVYRKPKAKARSKP